MSWNGAQYALECNGEWCAKILSGEKTVETRKYPLPADLIDQKILLFSTSNTGTSSQLPDHLPADSSNINLEGFVRFRSVGKYRNREEWLQDESRHCVKANSPFGWPEGQNVEIFGWEVESVEQLKCAESSPAMKRMQRSIFSILT